GGIECVYAVGKQNNQGAWNHVMTTLNFENGSKAFIEASHRMPDGYPFVMSMRVQSEEKSIDFRSVTGNNIESPIEAYDFNYYQMNQKTSINIDPYDPFQNELQYFIDCLE